MPHVVTEKCLGERYANCADICPTESFHPGTCKGEPFMAIDPETCIDCGACLPVCPIGAIVGSADESPEWAKINAEMTPQFKSNPKAEMRPADDPPRKPGNKLVK